MPITSVTRIPDLTSLRFLDLMQSARKDLQESIAWDETKTRNIRLSPPPRFSLDGQRAAV